MFPGFPTQEILTQVVLGLLSSGIVIVGMVLVARALMGTDEDERVEQAGYRAPWKLFLMGNRAPVMPVRTQLKVIALVILFGFALLAVRLL